MEMTKKVMPRIPEEIYKQLPTEVKKASYEAKNAAEKSSEEKLLLKTVQPTKLRWWCQVLSLLRWKQPGLWVQRPVLG